MRYWNSLLPRIQPFYAVKCAPDRAIISTLAALGAGFDCASSAEIDLVVRGCACAHVPIDEVPSRVIFANPVKIPSHIRHATQHGIHLMTFDNELELHKMAQEDPQAQGVIRITTDDSKSQYAFSAKFGASMATVPRLIEVARSLHINLTGVCFHVGSGCRDAAAYAKAVRDARTVFDMAESAGFHMDLLDVGGGFPGLKDSESGLHYRYLSALSPPSLVRL